jgi:mannose-6-phosphate isomerase|tara:strand:+ start:787 stop:1137 length:351 start_codon:yes stop_codon:yes gene_type:complete
VSKKKTIDKPWGYEEIWANTNSYVGKLICINPGARLSKQYHQKKEETIYVVEGVLINYDENDVEHRFFPGQSLHIPVGTVHRFGATDKSYVKVIEVSTNYLDDVVRLEDDYGRSKT